MIIKLNRQSEATHCSTRTSESIPAPEDNPGQFDKDNNSNKPSEGLVKGNTSTGGGAGALNSSSKPRNDKPYYSRVLHLRSKKKQKDLGTIELHFCDRHNKWVLHTTKQCKARIEGKQLKEFTSKQVPKHPGDPRVNYRRGAGSFDTTIEERDTSEGIKDIPVIEIQNSATD